MSAPYTYKAYGLTIASCLDCPQFPVAYGEPDVIIRYDHIDDHIPDIKAQTVCFQAAADQVLLHVPGIAKYLIQKGNAITIDRAPHTPDTSIQLFLWGSAFGALLHQRGLLVLHGSAVVMDGQAVLFLGKSGSGKSTLAAAFHQRGYAIATDDVSAIEVTADQPQLIPSFPQLKLWADVCTQLDQNPESLARVRPELEKYTLPLSDGFWPDPLPLKCLYVLKLLNIEAVRLEVLTSPDTFMALGQHTYRVRQMQGMGLSGTHLRHCTTVAQQVPLRRITRPAGSFILDELVALIEADWQ